MPAPALPSTPPRTLDELTLGGHMSLEDLVARDGLAEMVKSAHELFGLPIRVFTEEGKLLADATELSELHFYLGTSRDGRAVLSDVVAAVKSLSPGADGEARYACLTGAEYRVVAILFDARPIGRMILGPYAATAEAPASLLRIDAQLDADKLRALFAKLPRGDEQTVSRVARHLARVLDLLLFSGHRALLTSNMHLASVRESFRELEDKNQKLQGAFDRLKELDRLKSNFLATVSHELRTPLTSIIGYSEMLVEGLAGELTPEQRDFVQTIRDKGDQLLSLIKGLLDLSKLESGTMSLRRNNVDVGALVKDVVSTMAPTARKKEVELTFELESGLPPIWADAERLRQVLLNLTENAIKFTPASGSVRLSAKLGSMDAAGGAEASGMVLLGARRAAVEIAVADTGIGIPDSERSRVFDAFYQVDSSSTREAGGTGLGLSIVKRLVDGHDGVVRIVSNEPRGTVFLVTIPLKRATIG
jgi:two-component system, NarL family, sensor histidine kinase BarA